MEDRAADGNQMLASLERREFDRETLRRALRLSGPYQDALFKAARAARDKSFPSLEVETRSVIEISNKCSQRCSYCAMWAGGSVSHYLMDEPSFMSLVSRLYDRGRRVFLVQSGENDDQVYIDHVSSLVENMKAVCPSAVVILCLGCLSVTQYSQLHEAGAERYILKFETSNPKVFARAKPRATLDYRLECMDKALDAGFVLGSGNIVGLPGQTLVDIADDLMLLHKYNLDMNSTSVFIPNEGSVFREEKMGDLDIALNAMALMRIMNPGRLMPSTSSLERAKAGGQYMGLMAGANTVTVHDGTPKELKPLFPIYSLRRVSPQLKHMADIVDKAGLILSSKPQYAN